MRTTPSPSGHWLLFLWACIGLTASVRAEVPAVVVSIKPIHSLVAGVMQGLSNPELLIPAGQSPHSYSLRPSDARKLNQADIVFWVGEELETTLTRILAADAGQAQILELMALPHLRLLPVRRGGVWEAHSHGLNHQPAAHDHAHHTDPHLWLSPVNAVQLIDTIAERLSALDPGNAEVYQSNAAAMLERLQALDKQLEQMTTAIRDVPYIVFHDAYQYFERHYVLHGVGAVTISPDRPPGVKRIRELRDMIARLGVRCVFSQPQFEPQLIRTIMEGSSARTAVLDPLGQDLRAGPELYFELMQQIANAFVSCLGGDEHHAP